MAIRAVAIICIFALSTAVAAYGEEQGPYSSRGSLDQGTISDAYYLEIISDLREDLDSIRDHLNPDITQGVERLLKGASQIDLDEELRLQILTAAVIMVERAKKAIEGRGKTTTSASRR
jgi:hypothetical protein